MDNQTINGVRVEYGFSLSEADRVRPGKIPPMPFPPHRLPRVPLYSGVYFIRRESDGALKIGFSGDAERRLATLQVSSPETLTLLSSTPGKEAEWHKRFSHLHIRGEWFSPGVDLLAVIETLL